MKPSRFRYLLAHTANISVWIGVVGALAVMLVKLHSEGILIPKFGVVIWIALAAIPVAAIGWIVGLIFIWHMMLGHVAAWLQGWPFFVGDRVWILIGKHKGTNTTVYAVWSERGQVRVELGREAKEKVEDVYCAVGICRAPKGQASPPPKSGADEPVSGSEAAKGFSSEI
jgi:hypothetical protein